MTMILKILLIGLLSLSGFAFSTTASRACESELENLSKALLSKDNLEFVRRWQDSFSRNQSRYKAIFKRLRELQANSQQELPRIYYPAGSSWAQMAEAQRETWIHHVTQQEKQLPTLGSLESPIEMISRSKVANSVFEIGYGNQQWFFRPITKLNAVMTRRDYAAYKINRRLGLETVPEARLVRLWTVDRGRPVLQLGLLSDAARGAKVKPHTKRGKTVREDILEKINDRSKSENLMFEFLVGNNDVQTLNFRMDEEGTMQVFDHDTAFHFPLINDSTYFVAGRELPDVYPRDPVQRLLLWSPTEIRDDLAPYLAPMEINHLLLRRKIILLDVELRGSKSVADF